MPTELETVKLEARRVAIDKYNKYIANYRKNTITEINRIVRNRRLMSYYNYQKTIHNIINNYYAHIKIIKNELNNKLERIDNMTLPKKEEVVVTNEPNEPNEPKEPEKKALFVGINYTGSNYELDGCINDLEAFDKMAQDYYGFTDNTYLRDDKPESMPTKKNILASLEDMLKSAQEGSTLLFCYSGHGSYVRDKDGNEPTGMDQVIVPCDFDFILDDELKVLLTKYIKKGITFIAFFDCCNSGSVLDLKYQWKDSLFNDADTSNRKLIETDGDVIMISGCSDVQTSSDAQINSTEYAGAMRWSLMETLKNNKKISWLELLDSMRTLLKESRFTQIPQLSSGRKFDMNGQIFSSIKM